MDIFHIATAATPTATPGATAADTPAAVTTAMPTNAPTAAQIALENMVKAHGGTTFLFKLLFIPVTIIAALVILFILKHLFRKLQEKDAWMTPENLTLIKVVYSVLRFAILLVTIIIILDISGINVTGAVAGMGIAAAIGGLAVQDLLKDLITGMNIVSEHYFAIGDMVDSNNIKGKVIALSMRSTKIEGYDQSITTIQNHMISQVTKISETNTAEVPLPYDLERSKAYALMDHIAEEIQKLEDVTSCRADGIQELGDSSITYILLFYCNPENAMITRRHVNVVIINELDKAGVEIPYPQLDVHHKAK